jgi:cellulose synthase/poly-beta-1,6-N-acetylglucosamine synthase-like glycosyltransferase
MKVSVIIPSLNAPTLARALAAVAAQDTPADEVIVVGRDEAGVLAAYPGVRFIDTGQPACAAKARNVGMAAATGDIFLLLDADCIPRPDWLGRHVARHEAGEFVVGGSVDLQGSNYWAQSDNVSMFHEFVPGLPGGSRSLLPTLNLSVRREAVTRVGPMDESFPGAAAEDADWTIRLGKAGYRLTFDPSAVVAHAPARTTWSDVVRHWRNLGHNAIRVRLRYPEVFNTPSGAAHAWWWRMLSPIIAARVTAGVYAKRPLRAHWSSLPVVYATKIIYCWGAAQSIDSGFARQP